MVAEDGRCFNVASDLAGAGGGSQRPQVAVTAKVFEPSTSRSENQMFLQGVRRLLRTGSAITNVSREPEHKKTAFTMVRFFFGAFCEPERRDMCLGVFVICLLRPGAIHRNIYCVFACVVAVFCEPEQQNMCFACLCIVFNDLEQ